MNNGPYLEIGSYCEKSVSSIRLAYKKKGQRLRKATDKSDGIFHQDYWWLQISDFPHLKEMIRIIKIASKEFMEGHIFHSLRIRRL